MKFSDSDIQSLREGNQEFLLRVYAEYRNEFIKWAEVRYGCDADDAKDIFQDAVIAFYRNVADGRLTHMNSDIKTYLFAIGKNLLLNFKRKHHRISDNFNLSDINGGTTNPIDDMENIEEEEQRKELISKALEHLPEKCREILKLYYFENKDFESIAKKLNYKSGKVIRKTKSECMKKMAVVMRELRKNMSVFIF